MKIEQIAACIHLARTSVNTLLSYSNRTTCALLYRWAEPPGGGYSKDLLHQKCGTFSTMFGQRRFVPA